MKVRKLLMKRVLRYAVGFDLLEGLRVEMDTAI